MSLFKLGYTNIIIKCSVDKERFSKLVCIKCNSHIEKHAATHSISIA